LGRCGGNPSISGGNAPGGMSAQKLKLLKPEEPKGQRESEPSDSKENMLVNHKIKRNMEDGMLKHPKPKAPRVEEPKHRGAEDPKRIWTVRSRKGTWRKIVNSG
jgi:hypothetical protein